MDNRQHGQATTAQDKTGLATASVGSSQENQEENRQWPHASEDKERLAAIERGRMIRQRPWDRPSLPSERPDARLINPAVAALCENVRDYAIFLMNPDGVIVYWGMGAHSMKWWTKEEAEGAHLRLLYPEGGSEDGTAEEHLREAAETGESVGEGQRVRRGGSTFWAHITLTALYDPQGVLIGFAKVTQDLTERRAIEAAVALSNQAQSSRDEALATAQQAQEALERAEAARVRAEDAAQFARDQARSAQHYIADVLEPELAAEKAERAALGVEVHAHTQTRQWKEEQGEE